MSLLPPYKYAYDDAFGQRHFTWHDDFVTVRRPGCHCIDGMCPGCWEARRERKQLDLLETQWIAAQPKGGHE